MVYIEHVPDFSFIHWYWLLLSLLSQLILQLILATQVTFHPYITPFPYSTIPIRNANVNYMMTSFATS